MRRFGPRPAAAGGITFRLWAPAAKSVDLILDRDHPMPPQDGGWFEITLRDAGPGTRYRFRIDGDLAVPDPASAFQPEDVHGPSEVIDHSFDWCAANWRGRSWEEAVVLELHVGSFSEQGTFRGAIDKLDHVIGAGFTAIELMPVADFFGRWNWGYDGVLLFAPDSTYGRPEDLRALVDAAHQRGLMIFLDAVYNHFGPEGNYLGRYAPQFFTSAQKTPWGKAIDYTVPEVRTFAVENALYWLDQYRFDGLRLDAVHAIIEPGGSSMLEQLSREVGALAARSNRLIHLVLENDANRAGWLDPLADPPRGKYRAQWNDDYHHAWHVLLTGESRGYYRDYQRAPGKQIARVLSGGFAYQGEPSAHRGGAPRGEPSKHLAPTAFVNFLQNHDQIGNRPVGERLDLLASEVSIEAALAVLLIAPMPPMLFMGEEWGAKEPFPFFCDFKGELAEAVRRGRGREFADVYAALGKDAIPDPVSEGTFRSAVLDWRKRSMAPHAQRLSLVRRLLAVRREHVVPCLRGMRDNNARAEWVDAVITASWTMGDGSSLALLANLSDQPRNRPQGPNSGRNIWGNAPPPVLPPWSVFWSIG
jgi:maltooligosyltrehalose trehalohydrolase